MEIEVVAELVAERAQECPVRGDVLAYRRSHPQPDIHGAWVIVAEQLSRPVLANAKWPGGENPDATSRNVVESCCTFKELRTWSPDVGGFPRLHRRLDGLRDGRQDIAVRQVEHLHAVALVKANPVAVSWWCVGEHRSIFGRFEKVRFWGHFSELRQLRDQLSTDVRPTHGRVLSRPTE